MAGSIDLESSTTTDVTSSLKALCVCAQEKTDKIRISSIPPRKDKEMTHKIKALNDDIKAMCESTGYTFIDQDPVFYLMNGKVNGALLLHDGLHLTQSGVESLIDNCGIPTRGSPYTPDRYPKATEKLLFKGHDHPLSNFYPVKGLWIKGKYFHSSEAAYQHEKAKFMGNERLAPQIAAAKTGIHAMRLGSKVRTNEDWQTHKAQVMESVIQAKLAICKEARDALLKSGSSQIVEDTNHPFWARGQEGNGFNMMGQILTMFRRKMKEDPRMFRGSSHSDSNNRRWATRDYQPRCFRCGEAGHTQDRCGHGLQVDCWNCGDFGHKQKHCHVYSRSHRY